MKWPGCAIPARYGFPKPGHSWWALFSEYNTVLSSSASIRISLPHPNGDSQLQYAGPRRCSDLLRNVAFDKVDIRECTPPPILRSAAVPHPETVEFQCLSQMVIVSFVARFQLLCYNDMLVVVADV